MLEEDTPPSSPSLLGWLVVGAISGAVLLPVSWVLGVAFEDVASQRWVMLVPALFVAGLLALLGWRRSGLPGAALAVGGAIVAWIGVAVAGIVLICLGGACG
jgi:hypothetical protein